MKNLLIWGFISLFVVGFSSAQALDQDILSGKITVDGAPVSNAGVTLYLLNKEQAAYEKSVSSKTAENGLYRFEALPDGNYVFIVTKDGQRVYQGKVAIGKQRDDVKDIDLTAFLLRETGNSI